MVLSVEMRRRLLGALAVAALSGWSGAAQADPVKIQQGKATLPLAGLEIELLARPGIDYHVSGSWALTEGGAFDARDVVDEIDRASGSVVAGNWIMVGYFDAGDCDNVLQAASLDASWTKDVDIWGARWKVRGGVFTFSNAIGRRPTAVLCTTDASSRTLLLYHFLTTQPETLPANAVMSDVRDSKVLENTWQAYRAEKTQISTPLRRSEVRNRGKVPAQRKITLEHTGLEFALPDDGFVWLNRESDGGDVLDRMAPLLPEISIEVAVLTVSCAKAFETMPATDRLTFQATNLPPGWSSAPGLKLEDNNELVVCHDNDKGGVLAGVIQTSSATDVGYLHPLLAALASAQRLP